MYEFEQLPFTIVNIRGRPVLSRRFTQFDKKIHPELCKCNDCGKPSKYLRYEICPGVAQTEIWGDCGVCDIGG
jgi:hypothetical protein